MKKVLVGAVGSLLLVGTLTGCSESTMIYKDQERPVSEVEEIIADQLEVENPDLDLEVNISEETE
ncbi:sugar-binding protein [Bacillus phage 278BB001]|nr:sugar-binding protein [Bacillus phage 278BB001]